MRIPYALLVVSLLLAGCGDRQDRFEANSTPQGPYVAGNTLVYLNSPQEEMLVVDALANPNHPTAESLDLEPGTRFVMRLPDRKALVLQKTDNTVTIFYPEAGDQQDYLLTAPFNKFVYAPEQGLLACYFSGNIQTTDGQLVNKGQVAFLDLNKPGSVVEKVLSTYGGEPLGIDIAPVTGQRNLVLVRWLSYLSLLDARNPDFVPISIPTKAPDSESDMIPGPIQFQATAATLNAWFLDSDRGDVYQLTVDVAKVKAGGEGVGINIFPAIPGATSFAPFTTGEGTTALLVISPYRSSAAVVHPETSKVDIYELDIQPSSVQVFKDTNGDWALLSDPSNWTEAYYVGQLSRLVELKSKAFKKYALPAPATAILALDQGQRFLALHPKGYAGVLSVVTTLDGSAVTLGSTQESLRDWVFFRDQSLFFALLAPSSGGLSLLRIDTASMLQRSLPLSGTSVGAMVKTESPDWILLSTSQNTDLLMVPGDFTTMDDAWLLTAPEWLGLVD